MKISENQLKLMKINENQRKHSKINERPVEITENHFKNLKKLENKS